MIFLLCGDLNIHHVQWLRWSAKNTREGCELQHFCAKHGLLQVIKEPTRGPYLLDLIITDFGDLLRYDVIDGVSDHKAILLHANFSPTCNLTHCWHKFLDNSR